MNQKMSVFSGKNKKFSISGVTFGIKNKKELFNVFDDFNKEKVSIQILNLQLYFLIYLFLIHYF